jgi:hypothetical protein
MNIRRWRSYKESIRAADKLAAENEEIIHLSSRFAKKTKMNSNRVQMITDGYHISHTDNN